MHRYVNLAVSGVLLAGLYSSMAYGLGLIYGVLRVVNLAHAGVIMIAAYATWVLHDKTGLDPYLAIPIILPAFFLFGVVLYWGLVRHLPRGAAGGVQSLLLLFGVWLLLRNAAYLMFTGNDKAIRTSYSTTGIDILATAVDFNERRKHLGRYATWTEDDLAEFMRGLSAQRVVDDRLWR